MAIPTAFIQELVARADVVDIVGRHVQLKKGGANFMGLCPFHGEKSPSFSVSPSKQFYHCFGCGKNGNVISFLMDFSGMGFVDAVKELAQQYGMQVPEEDASPEDRARAAAQRERQQTLSDVLEKANAAYRKELKTATRAVEYLKGRGVSGQVAKDFGLGYAPEGWRSLASVFPHYDDPLLVESGLVILAAPEDGGEEKRYDRFRDRVMFPIRNVKGECIGFGARVLGDEKPKYLNSPETPVFSKGRELYGLFEARSHLREAGYALVTEGYMDVVALAQLGFPNAVATLGTACTADHVQKLFRFTDAVVFSFDGDAAGRRAAHKALEAALPFATDVRSVKFLFLPPEHDPDSYVRAHGREAFADMVKQATPLSKFLLDSAAQDCDLGSAEGRAQLATRAKALWMQLPEGALKMQIFADIAALVQIGPRELAD
ncbi:MAG: DNA primase, partial [Betaproteobacteria bacterium]|nr:DNA primase [Betaproteobacteria bacterium]